MQWASSMSWTFDPRLPGPPAGRAARPRRAPSIADVAGDERSRRSRRRSAGRRRGRRSGRRRSGPRAAPGQLAHQRHRVGGGDGAADPDHGAVGDLGDRLLEPDQDRGPLRARLRSFDRRPEQRLARVEPAARGSSSPSADRGRGSRPPRRSPSRRAAGASWRRRRPSPSRRSPASGTSSRTCGRRSSSSARPAPPASAAARRRAPRCGRPAAHHRVVELVQAGERGVAVLERHRDAERGAHQARADVVERALVERARVAAVGRVQEAADGARSRRPRRRGR